MKSNPSIERTRGGSAGLALISFWALRAVPVPAAHVKRQRAKRNKSKPIRMNRLRQGLTSAAGVIFGFVLSFMALDGLWIGTP